MEIKFKQVASGQYEVWRNGVVLGRVVETDDVRRTRTKSGGYRLAKVRKWSVKSAQANLAGVTGKWLTRKVAADMLARAIDDAARVATIALGLGEQSATRVLP